MKRKVLTLNDILKILNSIKEKIDSNNVTFSIETEMNNMCSVNLDQLEIHKIIKPDLNKPGSVIESYDIKLTTNNANWITECIKNQDKSELMNVDERELMDIDEDIDVYEECEDDENKLNKTVDLDYALDQIHKMAKTIAVKPEQDMCTDEWPGDKHIITPDKC